MDLYPCVNGSDPRMHRTLTPRPRWYRPLKRSMNLASRLASWELAAGIRKLCPHAHDRNVVGQEKKNLKSWCTRQLEADVGWKIFRKIKLDYYMGYDRNYETNLTKEKIKWDLIYTH